MFVIVVLVLSVACGSSGSNSNSSQPKTFRVNKSTGLYDAIDVDAEQVDVLSVGDKVRDTMGRDTLTCLSNDEGMVLCKVEVGGTGKTGYVLRQWIDY